MNNKTKMTAEQLLNAIEEMENGERIKLLSELYKRHYDNRPTKEVMDRERHRALYPEDFEA